MANKEALTVNKYWQGANDTLCRVADVIFAHMLNSA